MYLLTIMVTDDKTTLEALKQQNEQLKNQLMATSVLSEITKMMLLTPTLEAVFKTMMLGIKETMDFERIILFKVVPEAFCLRPFTWMGVNDNVVKDIKVSLSSLEGGELVDTIFLCRSIIVDPVSPEDDPMAILKPKSYLSLPIIAKTYARCHEFHKCNLKECPAYENPNPHCWSVPGSGQRNKDQDEDQKRRNCVNCKFFKGNHILWMDKPSADILVTSDEITLLTTLTNQAGIIVDNFQTYENLEKANAELTQVNRDLKLVQSKINRDLKQAQEIQQGLLPQVLPQTEYFTTAADYIPATKVGGDYYDIFEIEKDCYCVLVADVSGHDIAAALIMSMAKILIKSHANPHSAKKTIDRVNAILNSDIKNENFITMFYAIIDFKKRKMIYSSAGHNPVILIDRETKDITPIKAEGIFLGVFDDAMVKDNEALLKKNNRLILYTDGLIEAENMTGEMYSYEKLIEIIKKTVKLHTNEVKSEIIKDLNNHIGKAPIEDDITLMILDFN